MLVGQVTEQCILYSALDAYVRRFSVAVPHDAVAGIHPDLADAALRMMKRNMRADITPAHGLRTVLSASPRVARFQRRDLEIPESGNDSLEAGFAGLSREVERMAQYMLLIYGDPANAPGPDEREALYAEWLNYTNSLVAAGVMVSGAPLEGTEQATTVRSRGGEVKTTDGPFAETQEILGGYYVVDVPDRAAAETLAGQMPSIESGSVEVRPVVVFPDAA